MEDNDLSNNKHINIKLNNMPVDKLTESRKVYSDMCCRSYKTHLSRVDNSGSLFFLHALMEVGRKKKTKPIYSSDLIAR